MSDRIQGFKQAAAGQAAALIRPGMLLGLGTGSTTAFALERIAERLAGGDLKGITGIPTSDATERAAISLGIPLTTLERGVQIDLTIDGADEVDPQLDLIKGGGGALLREKIVAQASRRVVIVVDDSKLSERLGSMHDLPVEVLPFGWGSQVDYLESLGAKVLRRDNQAGDAFVTDSGHWILDCRFGPLADPESLAVALESRAGIVAHGLFLGLASDVFVAGPGGVNHLRRA